MIGSVLEPIPSRGTLVMKTMTIKLGSFDGILNTNEDGNINGSELGESLGSEGGS